MTWLLDIRVLPVLCFYFVFCPPAQVEARRSVTAGHGPVTTGRPVGPVRGHAQSRPVTLLRVGSRPSRRQVAGPAAQASTARESLAHDTLALRGQSCVCSVRHESPRPLESLSAVPPGPRRCPPRRYFAATRRSCRRTKCPKATKARCRAIVPRHRRRQDRALPAARRSGNQLFRSPPPRIFCPELDQPESQKQRGSAESPGLKYPDALGRPVRLAGLLQRTYDKHIVSYTWYKHVLSNCGI